MKLRMPVVRRWRRVPLAGSLLALLLLAAGLGIIYLNEADSSAQRRSDTRVQAEILGASVVAALDFADRDAAQEAVAALRVNPEVRAALLFDQRGDLFAGFTRGKRAAPANLAAARRLSSTAVVVEVPVSSADERIGTIRLERIGESVSRRVSRYSLIGLFAVMAALVAGVLGVAASALRRANGELEARARALATTNHELQVQMSEREKAEDQLRQAQKMQALGQLTGGIAHDFNNLLTVILGSADILQRPRLDEDRRIRFASAIAQTAARAAALTSQLLAFARRQPLKPEIIDLNRRIEAMSDLLDRTLGERMEVRIELDDEVCAVEADPAQLEAAILNVAVNARDAMPEGGVLILKTASGTLDDGRRATEVMVIDSGEGMDADTLNRVFEPFFTTKAIGKGTGLGLSQVYGFATQSGGDVKIVSEPGRGTTVRLLLPCTDEKPEEAGGAGDHRIGATRVGQVLVVDDNEDVGAFAEAMLRELGHQVRRVHSAEEALEVIAGQRFDVVFSDVVMPGMGGIELADRLRAAVPDLPVVLTTGYSDRISDAGTGGLPVVFKPYRLDALARALDTALRPAATASPPPG